MNSLDEVWKPEQKHIVPHVISAMLRLPGCHGFYSLYVRQSAAAMSSLQKKVIVRGFAGNVTHGYLPPFGFTRDGVVQYLNLQGRSAVIPIPEIKTICYVRDFNLTDTVNPERLMRRSFMARPRGDGLWVRVTFKKEADLLEGLMVSGNALLDALIADQGVYLAPPDTRANTQRVYVPRAALADLQILAVIGAPSRKQIERVRVEQQSEAIQAALFEGTPGDEPK